jgi:hypothetical protein
MIYRFCLISSLLLGKCTMPILFMINMLIVLGVNLLKYGAPVMVKINVVEQINLGDYFVSFTFCDVYNPSLY